MMERLDSLVTNMAKDVVVVFLMSSIPLGIAVACKLWGWLSRYGAEYFGTLLGIVLIVGVMIVAVPIERTIGRDDDSDGTMRSGGELMGPALSVSRSLMSIACCLAGSLMLIRSRSDRIDNRSRFFSGPCDRWSILVAVVMAFVLPAVYVNARCEHGWKRFEELRQSVRLGEAYGELVTIRMLAPGAMHRGRSVEDWLRELRSECDRVAELRRRIPHPPTNVGAVLEQSRLLAILGDPEAALGYLRQYPDAIRSGEGNLLFASIHESQQSWALAMEHYILAKKSLGITDDGTSSTAAGFLSAIRGEAFCRRKLGDLVGAESSYRDLIRLEPTAGNAMLLAYFYEDTQQTELANQWLHEAVKRNPALADEANRLAKKMANSHFGCFRVRPPMPRWDSDRPILSTDASTRLGRPMATD